MASLWRTVRVFISSTFRDMQAERDHLVRFVFPRLREALHERQLHLVETDLRWGVTSEQDAVEVCREIIDECRPRFLCVLGGRFGWIPRGQERSITADEVHYAVLDRPRVEKAYSFFYFRDPAATQAMFEERPGEVREPAGSANARRLEELKRAIGDAGYEPVIYPATWDDRKRRLVGLEVFGERVYDDVMASVDDEFGREPPEKRDDFAVETSAMQAFVEEHVGRYVVGSRRSVLDEMAKFTDASGEPNILTISGSPGTGKSALLAKFLQWYSSTYPANLVVSHFIGASAGSTDLRRTLRQWCHHLAGATDQTDPTPEDLSELIDLLPMLLKQAAASRRVVLLIDALNQMDATDSAHRLHWLAREFPGNVRVIISSGEHAVLEQLRRRSAQMRELALEPLTRSDARAIVEAVLRRFHKRMSDEQIELLLAKADSGNPLYLLTALEELRTLGTYEEITRRIRDMREHVGDLIHWILTDRLSNDPGFHDGAGNQVGAGLVRRLVSLIAVSRHGLSHSELSGAIAPDDPHGNVAALERLLRPYLMFRGELLDFYHAQFRVVVERAYLGDAKSRRAAHRTLADYFECGGLDSARTLSELPYHLTHLGDHERLVSTLTSAAFLGAKVCALGPQPLVEDCRRACDSLPALLNEDRQEDAQAIRLVGDAIELSSHILSEASDQFATQITGRLVRNPNPRIQRLLAAVRGSAQSPWLRPVVSGLARPGGTLVRTMSGYAARAVAAFNDGHRLAVATAHGLKILDAHSGEQLSECQADLRSVAVSPDNTRVVAGCETTGMLLLCDDHARLLHCLEAFDKDSGHATRPVGTVNFAAGGRLVVSAAVDGAIRIWDVEHGGCRHVLRGYKRRINAPVGASDAKHLPSTDNDPRVGIWPPDSGESPSNLETDRRIHALAIHPDGDRLLIGHGPDMVVWSISQKRQISILRGAGESFDGLGARWNLKALLVHPDGDRVLVEHDGNVVVWSLAAKRQVLVLGGGGSPLAVHPDGRRLAGVTNGQLSMWNLETGDRLETLQFRNVILLSAQFSNNGDTLWTVASDGALLRWRTDEASDQAPLVTHHRDAQPIGFLKDGRTVVSFGGDSIKTWDSESGDECSTFRAQGEFESAQLLKHDSLLCAEMQWEATVIRGGVIDAVAGQEIKEIDRCARQVWHHTITIHLAVVPRADRAVMALSRYDLYVIDTNTFETVDVIRCEKPITALHAAADDVYVALGLNDGVVELWDVGRLCKRHSWKTHEQSPTVLRLAPSKQLVTADAGGTIKCWNSTNGELLWKSTLPPPPERAVPSGYMRDFATTLYIVPTGNYVVAAGFRIYLLDLANGALRGVVGPHSGLESGPFPNTQVDVLAEGELLVSIAPPDSSLNIWDLKQQERLTRFVAESALVGLTVSATGRLVVGESSGVVHSLVLEQGDDLRENFSKGHRGESRSSDRPAQRVTTPRASSDTLSRLVSRLLIWLRRR